MNRRVLAIPESETLAIAAKVKQLKAQGREVFGFAAGEPDFDTPEHIKHAAARALTAGQTKYCPAAGLLELREAVAQKLKQENGLDYAPGQVVVSNGAKHSLHNVILALCDEGDEVILPAPYWVSYPVMIRLAGAVPVEVPCSEANDLKMTPDQFRAAITPRTRAVILNSPSNPIGVVYSEAELRALAEVAVKHGIYIISDEIYERMVYDGVRHVSIGSFAKEVLDLTITVNGVSKAYSMTGWRIGYLAAPKKVADAVVALQSHATSGPNTFAQFGALEAIRGPQDCVRTMVAAFEQRRTYIYRRLTAMPGVTCVKPQGAFYVLPSIAGTGMDPVQFSDRLLDRFGVAVVPGTAFKALQHVRLSYACDMETIRQGMDRMESFLKSPA